MRFWLPGSLILRMPFIRYQSGDTAVFSDIDMDVDYIARIIEDIVGRKEDYIVTPEGLHSASGLYFQRYVGGEGVS